MSKLLICYIDKQNNITWVLKDQQDVIIKHSEENSLSDVRHYSKIKSIILVPAEDILLTMVTLPKVSHNHLKKAIPFAVEEQVLEDINNLHIVSGRVQADGSFPIAVIAKKVIQEWLKLLKQYNIFPSILTSVVFAVPLQQAYSIEDSCIIRMGRFAGFSCQVDHLPVLMKDAQFKQVNVLELLSSFSQQEECINLLQGDYKIKRKKIDLLILFLCAVILFSNILSFGILEIQSN